jgi:AcrR family transcriptional regulator
MKGPEHDRHDPSGDLDAAVTRYALAHPQMGQAKVAAALRAQGIDVSASGVRYLWRKRGLETTFKRLKAIEQSGAPAALTETQRAIVRRGDARQRFAGRTNGTRPAPSRQLILAAAAELFVEEGYAGASVRKIAARMGLLAGSVYHHYPAKEDLFIAVQKEGFRQIIERVQAAIRASDEPWERLVLACTEHVTSVVAGNPIARVTATGLFAIHERALQRRLKHPRERYEAMFRKLIAALELPRGTDRTMFRLVLFGALNWTLVWYRPGKKSPSEVARRIVSILRGASASSQGSTR